jgi:hypothetical protein
VTPPKNKHGVIQPKVRAAIDHMVLDGKDLAAAAAAAGMTTARLRKYLTIPHIHKYAWHRRREQLEALCLATPTSLRNVIETSPNAMARVAAVRQAEAIRREDLIEAGQLTAAQLPGIQVVIMTPATGAIEATVGPPALTLEAKPIEAELDQHSASK